MSLPLLFFPQVPNFFHTSTDKDRMLTIEVSVKYSKTLSLTSKFQKFLTLAARVAFQPIKYLSNSTTQIILVATTYYSNWLSSFNSEQEHGCYDDNRVLELEWVLNNRAYRGANVRREGATGAHAASASPGAAPARKRAPPSRLAPAAPPARAAHPSLQGRQRLGREDTPSLPQFCGNWNPP